MLDEFYVRDLSGKEIAIYSDTTLSQWNVYGLDNVGKINSDNKRYYYMKDHLGSIRVILDTTNTVISAQDYDAWGYLLENRTYSSEQSKYKFTNKERDNESNYDYFGARYYDARIGRWGGVDPQTNQQPSLTSYQYGKLNPLFYIDPDGNIEVPKEYKEQYPQLYSIIESKIEKLGSEKKVMDAMIEATGRTEEQIKEGLKFGQGPKLEVTELGIDPENRSSILGAYDKAHETILLDINYVQNLENASGEALEVYTFLIETIILHEGAHAGADQSGSPYTDVEPGTKFEKLAFDLSSGNVQSYNTAVIVMNNRNAQAGISKRYEKIEGGW